MKKQQTTEVKPPTPEANYKVVLAIKDLNLESIYTLY